MPYSRRKTKKKTKKKTCSWWKELHVYLIERSTISKNEIDGPLDETFSEIMPPTFIIKSVLGSIKSTSIKCSHIACNSKCHGLRSNHSREWRRSCVLLKEKNNQKITKKEMVPKENPKGNFGYKEIEYFTTIVNLNNGSTCMDTVRRHNNIWRIGHEYDGNTYIN